MEPAASRIQAAPVQPNLHEWHKTHHDVAPEPEMPENEHQNFNGQGDQALPFLQRLDMQRRRIFEEGGER